MKCEYFMIRDDGFICRVIIEKGKLIIKKENNEQVFEVDLKESFNSLVSLFAIKNSWKKEVCVNPIYQVNFVKEDEKEIFQFNIETLPDNWSMFLAYVSKLVGDAI